MGLLAMVFLWPLLILVLGVLFMSSVDVSGALFFPIFLVFIFLIFGISKRLTTSQEPTYPDNAERIRRGVISCSLAFFLPIFVKYLLLVSGPKLPGMVLGLIIGFGILVWGMFIHNNKVLTYANILGGAFVIIYLYFQLGSLGQLAQVVAAGFGLVIAIVVSIIKFREKLT